MRFLVLLFALGLAACGGQTARHATKDVPVDAARAAALISQYRAAHGLGPVTVDAALTDGNIQGHHVATGVRPRFLQELVAHGINIPGAYFDPSKPL